MTQPTPTPSQLGKALHRKEVRWQIIVPFFLAVLFILGVVALIIAPQDGNGALRIQAVADLLFTLFCICPCVIVLFALYVAVMALVWGVNRLHDGAEAPLTRLENLTEQMKQRVAQTAQTATDKAVTASATIAPLMKILSVFDTNEGEKDHDGSK